MITLFKDPLFNTLDKVFDDAYLRADKKTNITKEGNDYHLQISVPGLTKDDIKISIKDNVMSISYDKNEQNKIFTFTNSFRKSYELPEDVDDKHITGTVENGILEIVIPTSKKKTTERLISLN